MNRLIRASSNYLFMLDKSSGTEEWIHERSRVSVIMICARAASKKEGICFWLLSCHAFARLLLADLELVLWSRRVVVL